MRAQASMPREALAASEDLNDRMARFMQQRRGDPPLPLPDAPAASAGGIAATVGLPPFSGELALGGVGPGEGEIEQSPHL